MSSVRKLFVLDTNILMHDPTALFNFQEHDIFIPMIVLEELDNAKKGMSEVSQNVRQTSRFIDALLKQGGKNHLAEGIPLSQRKKSDDPSLAASGRLFFETTAAPSHLPQSMPGQLADNSILNTVLSLKEAARGRDVILVSKDINLRIKASVLGIHAEDYQRDKVLDDMDMLYKGYYELDESFWQNYSQQMQAKTDANHQSYYEISGEITQNWQVNTFVYEESSKPFYATVTEKQGQTVKLKRIINYQGKNSVWGIEARNREQNFALNLLMNPEIDFVTLMGTAGTGKTLLTLAAALTQTIEEKRYSNIIMTRVTIPVGEDIGFLPGTEEEKMTPWMGALMDNLEVLTQHKENDEWQNNATSDFIHKFVKIHSLNFMRGRTFLDKFLIIDEAQNLTAKQMKTLITRAGPGTKVVCLGNVAQIDTPYLTETTSGLTYAVDKFKGWTHSGHIILQRGERSRLADYAAQVL